MSDFRQCSRSRNDEHNKPRHILDCSTLTQSTRCSSQPSSCPSGLTDCPIAASVIARASTGAYHLDNTSSNNQVSPLIDPPSVNADSYSKSSPDIASHTKLTLAECIVLAVQNNRDLASGRLDQLVGEFFRQDAEDEFRLIPSFGATANQESMSAETGRDEVSRINVSPRLTLRIPTGGTLSLNANNRLMDGETAIANQFVQFEFRQPLLRGGGFEVGTSRVQTARRTQQIGVHGFESAIMSLITRTIYAYRNVIQSKRAVDIAERSLQRANELLAVNRALIETGRMAEQDIVETEANVAERELSLTEAKNSLDDAQLRLIDILDIDSRVRIEATETLSIEQENPNVDRTLSLALENRPDYLSAQLRLANTETSLAVANNARKWEVDLVSSSTVAQAGDSLFESYDQSDDTYQVGLSLNIPIGASAAKLQRSSSRAKIALQQSKLRLAELLQSIEIEVSAAVRNVNVQFRRSELARQARELAEQKLEIEQVKLNFGRTTNFRLVRFEDDVVRSQNNEVSAVIAYLNALTALDQTRGTTLETWQIEIEVPEEELLIE